jgi:S1-C subfamily serine protease
VTGVAAGSPAESAGFRKGDVLVAFNGIALTEANQEALKKAKTGLSVGSRVTYTVSRAGARSQITATLAEVPREVLAQWEKE